MRHANSLVWSGFSLFWGLTRIWHPGVEGGVECGAGLLRLRDKNNRKGEIQGSFAALRMTTKDKQEQRHRGFL